MKSITINTLKNNTEPLIEGIEKYSICPSKEEAKKIFWGLGDQFWMQVIEFHEYGPMVFDEGLHKGPKEPGFFDSLRQGCLFASEHLCERLSVSFYKELHEKLCAHFKGKVNSTEIEAWQTGQFRSKMTTCSPSINSLSKEAHEHYANVYIYECEMLMEFLRDKEYAKYQKIREEYQKSKKWCQEWEEKWDEKLFLVDAYLSEKCKELSLSKFTKIFKSDLSIYIAYDCAEPEMHEMIIQKLFDDYHSKMDQLQGSREEILHEKIKIIAHLFQMLEWLHPFPDGQGRTDLVLLSKLLSEEGLNPPILEQPYFSTWSLLPEWQDYLLKGIHLWQKKKPS